MDPLITFIMCSRKKDNPDSDIIAFLKTLDENMPDNKKKEIEILVKFDTDDDESYQELINRNHKRGADGEYKYAQANALKEYPFPIQYFIYNRGEGRRSLHNDYMFLSM